MSATIICLLPADAFKYFQTLSCQMPIESVYRLGTKCTSTQEMLKIYQGSLLTFTQAEINALQWYVNMLSKIVLEKAPRFFTPIWKFIKLKKNIDWNFPYTIGDAIVLPEVILDEMVQTRCNKNPTNSLSGMEGPNITNNVYANRTINHIKILFHEYVHIYQRHNQDIFNRFYTDFWNFTPINPSQLKKSSIYENKITNPDSISCIEWVISIIRPGTNKVTEWYYPMMYLNPITKSHQGILIPLDQVQNTCTGKFDYYMKNNYELIDNVREYKNKFYGLQRQLYDVNEIMANILTDYVIANIEYTNPSFSSNGFYTALRPFIGAITNVPHTCLRQIGCNAC